MARIILRSLVAFVQLLQADHVSHDFEPVSCRCSPNPNPHASYTARAFASGWLRRSFAAPGEERAFGDALCRLGQTATLLHDDDVERLVHIDSDLDRASAAIKLPPGSLV